MEALRGVPRAEIVAGPSRGGGLALGLARDEALAEEVELAVVLVHPPGPVHVLRLVRVDELRRRGGPVGGVVVEGHVVALELFVVVGAVVVAVEAEARGDDAHRGGHGHDAGDADCQGPPPSQLQASLRATAELFLSGKVNVKVNVK